MDWPSSGGPPRTRSVTGDGRTRSSSTSPAGRSTGGRRIRRIRHQTARGRGQEGLRELTGYDDGLGLGGGGLERGGGRRGRAEELRPELGARGLRLRFRLPGGALEVEEWVGEVGEVRGGLFIGAGGGARILPKLVGAGPWRWRSYALLAGSTRRRD